jgi:hypothetical protein
MCGDSMADGLSGQRDCSGKRKNGQVYFPVIFLSIHIVNYVTEASKFLYLIGGAYASGGKIHNSKYKSKGSGIKGVGVV